MRILAIDLGATRRGGQKQTLLLARALAARGHDVAVAARTASPLASDARAAGLPLEEIRPGFEAHPGVLADLAGAVRRFQPDVLHAGDARAHGAAVFSRAARRVPLVVHRRVVFLPKTHILSRLKYAAPVRYVAVAEAVATSLRAAGVPASRIAVVPDGLPAEAFVSRPPPPEPPFRLVHVGAFDGMKGQQIALEIVDRLAAGGRDVTLTFLGDGAARPGLETLAVAPGPTSKVHFAGNVEDVTARLASSHLLLLPSVSEAVAYVLYEAMAAGCPVVAHDVGGVAETLRDGLAGRLVDGLDPERWAAEVGSLLDQPERRAAYREAGRNRARELTIEETARRVEAELVLATEARG